MASIEELNDIIENNDAAKPLMDIIQQIMELPDESLNETTIASFEGAVNGAFTPAVREQAIKQMLDSMEESGVTRKEVAEQNAEMIASFNSLIEELTPSDNKRRLIKSVFQILFDIALEAEDKYHNYSIKLPMVL